MKTLIQRLFPIFVLLLITACSAAQSKIDDGLITGKPCSAPCWNNLTPGLSTDEDVTRFFDSLNKNLWPERSRLNDQNDCSLFVLSDNPGIDEGNVLVRIYTQGERVKYIESMHPNMPTLGQIVKRYGPPEFIQYLDASDEVKFYILRVYYPKIGLAMEIRPDESSAGQIKEDMSPITLEYFAPGEMTDYFIASTSCNVGYDGAMTNAKTIIEKFVRPWPGFGKAELIKTR